MINYTYSIIFIISQEGAETMSNSLKGQFVKVPAIKINELVNNVVNVDPKKAMNELLEDPKLVKTLKKLSLV